MVHGIGTIASELASPRSSTLGPTAPSRVSWPPGAASDDKSVRSSLPNQLSGRPSTIQARLLSLGTFLFPTPRILVARHATAKTTSIGDYLLILLLLVLCPAGLVMMGHAQSLTRVQHPFVASSEARRSYCFAFLLRPSTSIPPESFVTLTAPGSASANDFKSTYVGQKNPGHLQRGDRQPSECM